MTDQSWDEQFKRFLQKTGEDFKRASEDIKAEAQKLVDAAMDPEKQQRVRDRLGELGVWARKAAHEVAGKVGEAATKAQTAVHTATEKVSEKVSEMKHPSGATAPAAPVSAPSKSTAAKKSGGSKSMAGKPPAKGGGKRKR
jgi:hypothetical protein